MTAMSKDLFDESTMTFGEHLEALRTHLFRAIFGLVIVMIGTLYWGNYLVDVIRTPIDRALKRNKLFSDEEVKGFWGQVTSWFDKSKSADDGDASPVAQPSAPVKPNTITVRVKPSDLLGVLHQADPKHFPEAQPRDDEKAVPIPMAADEFREFRQTTEESHHPVTLNVQEAFMMYIKVSLVSGVIFASPWIFYQLWLFVAAGLYPHERKYVHIYLPMSIALFLGGVLFCFFLALPLLLDFLLSYNRWLGVVPQIRLSEWVSFVILLPLMFGVCFQLPMVMLFLERIGIFGVTDYRTRRRLAIFVMAVGSMIINPGGDVGSMALLFVPLVILYEFGIVLCGFLKTQGPFEEAAAT
jgi:sec-independent protein translocase protein TatC